MAKQSLNIRVESWGQRGHLASITISYRISHILFWNFSISLFTLKNRHKHIFFRHHIEKPQFCGKNIFFFTKLLRLNMLTIFPKCMWNIIDLTYLLDDARLHWKCWRLFHFDLFYYCFDKKSQIHNFFPKIQTAF